MDAFAAALCKGLAMRKLSVERALVIALFFGGFQALMPLAGYFLAHWLTGFIEQFDHWIAFALLSVIGANMIRDGIKNKEEEKCDTWSIKELLTLAVATSIDALAVGISFAFLNVNIYAAAGIIGVTTFLLSFIGVAVGYKFGSKHKNTATVVGGAVLVIIGLKILIEHLLG